MLAVLVCARIVVEPFTVPSASMEPTIRSGDHLVVNRWTYGYHLLHGATALTRGRMPELGEVVVFTVPGRADGQELVKRVVGVPGDRIEVTDDGRVKRNGQVLSRCPLGDWVDGSGSHDQAFLESNAGHQYAILNKSWRSSESGDAREAKEVPPGTVFVLSDNRDNGLDSRHFGPIAASLLIGKVERIFGFGEAGTDPGAARVPRELSSAVASCQKEGAPSK